MADILTKGHFTRDEWKNLLCLFNIGHFSSLCCAKNVSLLSCFTERMAKRMEEQSEENRIVAKSRPMVMNLTISVATSSSSDRLDYPGGLMQPQIKNSNPDAASSSQGWQRDAQLFISTGKTVAMGKDQKSVNRQEESVISTGKLVGTEYQGCPGNPEIPEGSEDSKLKSRSWPHHFHISPDCVPHMDKVFSIVRKNLDRKPTDNLKGFDVNPAIWGKCMSVTLQAAVHLGRDYSIEFTIRQESIFEVCGALISDD